MKKINQKSSYKNHHFANSEPELLRVQINPCENTDDSDAPEQIFVNDFLTEKPSIEIIPFLTNNDVTAERAEHQLESSSGVITTEKTFVVDELNGVTDNFFSKKIADYFEAIKQETSELKDVINKTFQPQLPNVLLAESNTDAKTKIKVDEIVIPQVQTIENENLDLSNFQTELVIPKSEIITNETLHLDNLDEDKIKVLSDFVIDEDTIVKNSQAKLEIDDNHWTVVPNFDFSLHECLNEFSKNLEPFDETGETNEVITPNNDHDQKVNKQSSKTKSLVEPTKLTNKKDQKKPKSIPEKNNKLKGFESNLNDDITAPDIINVPFLTQQVNQKVSKPKPKTKKLNSKKEIKVINKKPSSKKKKSPANKVDLSTVKKADLIISSKTLKKVQTLPNQETTKINNYIKPNNKIIVNSIELNNESEFENNLIISPLPVSAETFQNYRENNLFLKNHEKNFTTNFDKQDLEVIDAISSLANAKRKFKGPQIVSNTPYVTKNPKIKKNNSRRKK